MSGAQAPQGGFDRTAPYLGQPEFAAQIAFLLPPGDAWQGPVQAAYWAAAADLMALQHARAATLTEVESDIAQAIELLPEWEADYGLPDPCTPSGASVAQRQAALVAKEAQQGGQDAAYFVQVAAKLGYAVTITTFTPAMIGRAAIGAPMTGQPWAFAWRINAPATTIFAAVIGGSTIGDPLRSWGNATLECRMGQIKPAHTVLLFGYS